MDYLFFETTDHKPHHPSSYGSLAVNCFGLMLFDLRGGYDLLLPNTYNDDLDNGGEKFPEHEPFLWAPMKASGGGEAEPDCFYQKKLGAYGWRLDKRALTFVALDKDGNEIQEPDYRFAKSTETDNPWHSFQSVPNLCQIKRLDLIDESDRSKDTYVRTRVRLNNGVLESGVPWSAAGLIGEWTFPPDSARRAMTDNCNFNRELPKGATHVRVKLTNLGGGGEKALTFPITTGKTLTLGITHLHPKATGHNPGDLIHNTAYALLLKGGKPKTFQTPRFDRGAHGQSRPPKATPWVSSEDGHCNCASCD